MGSEPAGERFSEKDVAAILRRAADIQTRKGDLSPRDGTTHDELVQIGGELGLDPAAIRQAIHEFSAGGTGKGFSLLGGPVAMELDRVFPGDVDDERWQDIVLAFRKAFGRVGTPSEVGAIREWSGGTSDLDQIHLSVHSKDGKTRVRALSDLSGSLFLTGIVTAIPGFMISVILLSLKNLEWGGRIALAIGSFCAFAALFRGFFGFMAKRRRKALEELFERLDETFNAELRENLAAQPAPALAEDDVRVSVREGESR